MKNKKWIIGIVILLAILGVIVYFMFFRNTNTTPESNYNSSRISYNTTLTDNENNNTSTNDSTNSTNSNETKKVKTETKISRYSS